MSHIYHSNKRSQHGNIIDLSHIDTIDHIITTDTNNGRITLESKIGDGKMVTFYPENESDLLLVLSSIVDFMEGV